METLWGIPQLYFVYFFVALIVSSIGFYRLVYFISIGYGLSIAAMGIISIVLFRDSLVLSSVIHNIILVIYGLRLGLFLLYRDIKTSYRKDDEEIQRSDNIKSIPLKITIWVSCSLLYTTMFAPALFHISTVKPDSIISLITIVGVVISVIGIILETLADKQKNSAKKKNPKLFVSEKLFKIVRQPNYFGEILVWTGSFIAGIPFYKSLSWWIIAIVGYVCIFLIMLGSSKRLEEKQENRYGKLNEFNEYSKSTPLLFPFLPIYSLKKWKIVLG